MNRTMEMAIPTQAPRDIVNRQAKHITIAASHASALTGAFFV